MNKTMKKIIATLAVEGLLFACGTTRTIDGTRSVDTDDDVVLVLVPQAAPVTPSVQPDPTPTPDPTPSPSPSPKPCHYDDKCKKEDHHE